MSMRFPLALALLSASVLSSQNVDSAGSSQTGAAHVALEEQQPSSGLRHAWIASLITVAGGNAMDIASSYGKQELNPLLRGANGAFDLSSAARKAALVSAVELPQIFLARRSPRMMKGFMIANFALSAGLAAISAHNFGISIHR